jgi:glucoamylase
MTGGTAPRPASMASQTWATGAKDLVMTALGTGRVWATTAHGILNEIYWPAVDQPQIKDFGFLVAGAGWWRELKRVNTYTLKVAEPVVALPTITHTASNYQVTLKFVVDPDRDAVLVEYEVTGAGVRLYPLLAPHLGVYQQQAPSDGTDNFAWVDPADNALFASAVGNRSVCVLAAPGFDRGSAGYVGDTDGWTDFSRHQAMTLTFSQAGPGVVALMGELTQQRGSLALGFAETPQEARTVAQQCLATGFSAISTKFTSGWQGWAAGLTLPGTAQGLSQSVSDAIRQSAAVLKTHEDRTVAGAFVAGLATPWGEDTNDPGGYHMVWCRDGTESGLALAAAGHTDDAVALLRYLTAQQQPDGHWPRCFFVNGSFDPFAAVQLDEVAFPVVFAARLEEYGVALPPGTDMMMRQAAHYLAQNGPISGVERWEENPGGSPFTIGLEVAAMLVAATRLSGQDQQYTLALADNWNERLEAFSFIAAGELDQFFGTDGHYVRIGPAVDQIRLGNQPSPTQPIDAEALVGMEFLYLARLGLRDPHDKKITDTLKIVESMLSKDTPSGRAYLRYNLDGYGEWLDGSGWPVRHFGIGRPWPLLAGERGQYDVLIGGKAVQQLYAMLAMRGQGGLLPEQIWDANPLPWRSLAPGKPAGSAMPLAWAHSELIKLAVAATTGRPIEMLTLVTNRYHAQIPTSDPWFWRDAAPVNELSPGRTLVIEDTQPFTLHFGFDEWQAVSELPSQPLGLGMFGVTLATGVLAGHANVQFVRRYADGHWEPASRNDVKLKVPRAPALQLSRAARARVTAGAAS